jgi:autotransporter-associated beta strand protein
LTLNYGTLNWNNFGLNAAGSPNPTRIAATNAVTLQGGTFTINGAGSTDTVATLNSVTVTGGNNVINTLPYINMGSTVQLNIGNLVRNTATKSGVVFNGFSANNSTGANTLGGQGLTTNSNIFLTQVNGAAFSASNLVDNLIGGWAVADGSTFATYSNTFGVVAMNNTYGGFAAPVFSGTDLSAATTAASNINDNADRTITGAKAINSLRYAQSGTGQTAKTITFAAGATLAIDVGFIANASTNTTFAATDAANTISGTGADLFFYINSQTTIVQPSIIGSAALISNGPGTLSLRPQFASNTYSGGTFVNNGTTTLVANPGLIAIPGDLTITGSANSAANTAVTMTTNAGQIAATSNVLINGGGNLTMVGSNTLNSVTFDNRGSGQNPTVATATLLILSSATPVTATNDSLATVPVISGTALQFSNATPVLSVNDGLAETELTISAPITQHASMTSLSKTGTGVLALSGASTFTTGFNLNQGGLMFGANSTGSPVVTSGPVGTGTLTIAGGTSLLSDGTARTIANATTVNGDFTFGGRVAGNGVTLSGAMNLGAAGRTITVDSPAVTSTISGAITSTATGTALTKAGEGTLVLSSATSNLGGAGVAVTGGILRNGIINAIPTASAVAVSAGAGYDLNGFAQTVDGISGAGFITNSANSAQTLTVSSTVTNSTFAGSLTDNILGQGASRLNLVKAGVGTSLTLSGINNYAGTTAVNAGTLQFAKQASLYNNTPANWTAGNINVKSGATLALNVGGTDEFTTGNVTTLLTNLAASSSATNGMNAGAILGLDTSNAAGGTFTVSDVIANTTGASGGSRGLSKQGAGTLVLSGANTYTGTTTVSAGRLQVADGTTGSIAASAVTVVTSGSTIVGAAKLSGGAGSFANSSTVGVVAGSTIIGDTGSNTNRGVLAPGITDNSNTSNQTLTFTAVSSPLTVAGGSQLQLSITTATTNDSGIAALLAGGTYVTAADYITNTSPAWTTGAPGDPALLSGSTTYGQYDFINVTSGAINLGTRNGGLGNGTVSIINNGYLVGAQAGDVFNLLDWTGVMGGAFTANFTGNFTSGGAWDDMDLPTLGSSLVWDTSAFASHGVLIVVPEPSRALLLLFGLLGLMMRRRRQTV